MTNGNKQGQGAPGILSLMKTLLGRDDISTSVFKALGDRVWFAAHTNNLQDRDGEIISEGAHDRYIDRVQKGLVPMPELWFWHIPGTKHGDTLALWRDGHVVCAAGRFDDSPAGRAAEKAYARKGPFELSHGFYYPKSALVDGIYDDYTTFEISVLPQGKASNPYTAFTEVQAMTITDEQSKALETVFGAEVAAKLTDESANQADRIKAIVGAGAKYKDFADTTAAEPAQEDNNKAVETLLTDVLEGQGEVISVVETMQKTFEAQLDRLHSERLAQDANTRALQEAKAALEQQVKALQQRLNDAPKRASEADETVVEDKAAKESLDKQQTGDEYDPMFPGMKVPKQNAGTS